jgi:hypothetical protein
MERLTICYTTRPINTAEKNNVPTEGVTYKAARFSKHGLRKTQLPKPRRLWELARGSSLKRFNYTSSYCFNFYHLRTIKIGYFPTVLGW